ncbi:MAG TPA: hypothetical protein VMD31_11330 [Opitutaceae bacterium]|nr:hypothetical protein [Opitutaceae bacterium]
MKPPSGFVDFNKQLLGGEIGALAGTPLFPLVAAHFTRDPALLSFSALVGGLLAGSAVWLVVKVRDEHRSGGATVRRLAGQIAWFTPAALILGLLVYQPTLFLLGRHLIRRGDPLVVAVLLSQALAFALFLAAMNVYRLVLHRTGAARI